MSFSTSSLNWISMQPITNSIFAPTYFGGARFFERPFSTASSEKNVDSSVIVTGLPGGLPEQVSGVSQSERGEKSADRQQARTPEKSTDVKKTRSSSGDILDISGELETRREESGSGSKEQTASAGTLAPEAQQQVEKLKSRDAEVRAHEAAHLATAGQYAKGGASFIFQTGPDGNRYAIGGEVSIDSSPVPGDPRATIQKAQQIRAAALAPANPSSQDQKVAAAASEMQAKAQLQVMQESQQESSGEEQQGGVVLQIPGTLSLGNSKDMEESGKTDVSDPNSGEQAENLLDSQSHWLRSTERLVASEREPQLAPMSSFSPFSMTDSDRSRSVHQVISEYSRNASVSAFRKEFLAYA